MRCPKCEHDTSNVKDSRPTALGSIRRRRICDLCGHRWTTWELTAPPEADLEETVRRGLTLALDPSGALIILGNRENLHRVLLTVRGEVDAALNDIEAMALDPMPRAPLLT